MIFVNFKVSEKKSEEILKNDTTHVEHIRYELAKGQGTGSENSPDKSYDLSLFHFFTLFRGNETSHLRYILIFISPRKRDLAT